jgi:hypothetical protein
MRATEVTTPGLYWHRHNAGSPWAFAYVVQCGEGETMTFHFVRLEGDPAKISESFDTVGTFGEFVGPIPESPSAILGGTVQGVRPETLAVVMLPLELDGTMQKLAKVWPKDTVRGGGNAMFIERKTGQ